MADSNKKDSFPLENPAWPAFIVDDSGVFRDFNYRAATTFSVTITNGATNLSGVWGSRNPWGAAEFLAQWKASQSVVDIGFKFKQEDEVTVPTAISLYPKDQQRYFVLQLLRPVKELSGQTESSGKNESGQSQKLECALKLARTVALDFNNALTSILGHTSLMLHRIEGESPWRNSLLEIEKSAERAAEVAHDLATFSLADKEMKDQAAGNLNELLRNTCAILKSSEAEGITWKHELERSLFEAKFDEAKMQQVFIKLLENSVQAFEDGGVINIITSNLKDENALGPEEIGLQINGPMVKIEISDDGKGVPKESLSRVFEPFFTTKEGHRGLGLAWVYGVVTNHGGTVLISSVEDEGTTVRVYLPAQSTTVGDEDSTDDEMGGDQTVMLVDDEELLLTMGEMILGSYGYSVITCNSGKRALEILKEGKKIDLLITDLVMPHMSGRSLVARMKVVAPDVPIICATGYVRPEVPGEKINYLQKPFTSQSLLKKVKEALGSKAAPIAENA